VKHKQTISTLVSLIAVLAIIAAASGLWMKGGPGTYDYVSIRGKTISIWGEGLYQHMSATVAPQGIAQDYVTLFIALPVLLFSLLAARRGSLRSMMVLTGTIAYFLVTYLFYLVMAMYNAMFLVYVALTGTSFYAFILSIHSLGNVRLSAAFNHRTPVKLLGGMLVFIAASIAMLWLRIVVPPLLDGSIIPVETEHYTTLIVQGLDLSILLPSTIIAGILLMRRASAGYLFAPVLYVFLSLLMTALMAKIITMAGLGYNVIPAVFIIPVFNLIAIAGAAVLISHITRRPQHYQNTAASAMVQDLYK
jgi:hypothetical protein